VIDWKDVPISGTSLRGYLNTPWSFEETVARLVSLSGQPAESADMEKTSVQFVGTFNGEVFTLYDYKEDREIHIGGHPKLRVDALNEVLIAQLEAVEPAPYAAAEYYDQQEGHQWP
jgi:hypothetical protein